MLWVLNLCDGSHTLLDIAERSGLRFQAILRASGALVQHGLLRDCWNLRGRWQPSRKDIMMNTILFDCRSLTRPDASCCITASCSCTAPTQSSLKFTEFAR